MSVEEYKMKINNNLASAKRGNKIAQANVGWAYMKMGLYYDAQIWFKKATSSLFKKESSSLVNLGYMHEMGYYFKKDLKKALKYYEQGSNMGSAVGSNNAGIFHYYGKADPNKKPNYKKALKYFLLAFERKNYKSCRYLGDIYSLGKGVAKNSSKAIQYLSKGLSVKDAHCYFRMGWCYDTGTCVSKNYKLARENYLKAVEYGKLAGAYSNLGRLYQYGLGVEIDLNKALEYYTKGAELNSPLSKKQLPIVQKQLQSNNSSNNTSIPDIVMYDECSKD